MSLSAVPHARASATRMDLAWKTVDASSSTAAAQEDDHEFRLTIFLVLKVHRDRGRSPRDDMWSLRLLCLLAHPVDSLWLPFVAAILSTGSGYHFKWQGSRLSKAVVASKEDIAESIELHRNPRSLIMRPPGFGSCHVELTVSMCYPNLACVRLKEVARIL